jgi:hypothetical protein
VEGASSEGPKDPGAPPYEIIVDFLDVVSKEFWAS